MSDVLLEQPQKPREKDALYWKVFSVRYLFQFNFKYTPMIFSYLSSETTVSFYLAENVEHDH